MASIAHIHPAGKGHWLLALSALMLFSACGAPERGTATLHGLSAGTETAPVVLEDAGVTEEVFQAAIQLILETYRPEVTTGGGHWDMRAEWSSDSLSAWSAKSGTVSRTFIAGGIARREEITADAFLLILCHETGHFLAGAPLGAQGLAAEGQADWYATRTCLPRLWAESDNTPAPATAMNPEAPEAVVTACARYGDEGRARLCQRSARAGWSTMHLAAVRRELPPPQFATPDPAVAPATITGYPALQCRLDTMLAGALEQDRPACWFAAAE